MEAWLAVRQLLINFGMPHVHSGIGIRKLRPGLYECRANRDLRFLFLDAAEGLIVTFLGNHDELQKELKEKW